MEKKIRETLLAIARKYGATLNEEQIEHIINLCLNDIACHPNMEKYLLSDNSIKHIVMQTVINDISTKNINKI